MSDGVPKSRVTLVYDTKQPEGREKPRELPFRLLVLGDVGGDKTAPIDQRKVRQLNGRNLGEVIKGLRVEVRDIDLGDAPASATHGSGGSAASAGGSSAGGGAASSAAGTAGAAGAGSAAAAGGSTASSGSPSAASSASSGTATNGSTGARAKARVRIDSMSSFSPDDVLRLLTGQKAEAKAIDPTLSSSWGISDPKEMWPGDSHLSSLWKQREHVVGFQKSYQNSKTLRAALKRFSVPPADTTPNSKEVKERKDAIAKMKTEIASALKAQSKPTT